MVVRSKAQVSNCLTSERAGSNLAEVVDVCLLVFVCCVGSGLCDELIARSVGSYPLSA